MVVAPARPNAVTMSTRCPAQVKRTAVTSGKGYPPLVHEERQLGDGAGGEQRRDDDPRAPAQVLERIAEPEPPGGCRREHVRCLQDVAVLRREADREVEVAENAERRKERRGEP